MDAADLLKGFIAICGLGIVALILHNVFGGLPATRDEPRDEQK